MGRDRPEGPIAAFETMRLLHRRHRAGRRISSTALDMTSWLRFLLRHGVRTASAHHPAALTTTWTPQIPSAARPAMAWDGSCDWQGKRLIGHDGAIGGFSATSTCCLTPTIHFVVL